MKQLSMNDFETNLVGNWMWHCPSWRIDTAMSELYKLRKKLKVKRITKARHDRYHKELDKQEEQRFKKQEKENAKIR